MSDTHPRKRIFLLLLAVSLLGLVALGLLLLWIATHRASAAVLALSIVEIGAVCVMLLLAAIGILVMAFSAALRHPLGTVGRFFVKAALLFYPAAMRVGRWLGVDKDSIRASFIELNNELVCSYHLTVAPERVLVLLPHCLQRSGCTCRISGDLSQCAGCGLCDIAAIRRVCESVGVPVAIVNGGTLARRAVAKLKPQAIVAVACERDLFSGILDVLPLPTLGVLNRRPQGPCRDTRVDILELEDMIRYFVAPVAAAQTL